MKTLPQHLDPAIPLRVPDELKKRMKARESSQRSRAKKLNKIIETRNEKLPESQRSSLIKIEKVDVIAVFNEQNWTCQCWRVPGFKGCFQRVDITKSGRHEDAPVFGHINNLDNLGNHTADNVGVMRHACNMKICHTIEKQRAAKTNRLQRSHSGFSKNGTRHKPKVKKRIPARVGGLQSRSKWPKGRALKSKGFSKKQRENHD